MVELNEELRSWLRKNIDISFESPRKMIFGGKIKNFKITNFDEEKGQIKIKFMRSKYPALPLWFWMFNRALQYLRENQGEMVPLGAGIRPPYIPSSVEGVIWEKPFLTGKSEYKVSSHICDILSLANIVQYGYTSNPKTGRKVQGVKLINLESRSQKTRKIKSKNEIIQWAAKHDEKYYSGIKIEKDLGAKIRAKGELTKNELKELVTWKFEELKGRKKRVLNLIDKNDDNVLRKVSQCAFNIPSEYDKIKIKLLRVFEGIGPSMASVILTFYDPLNYGVFDIHVWRELFGKEDTNLFTTDNYLRLLSKLREISKKYELDVRTVEKALFSMNKDAS